MDANSHEQNFLAHHQSLLFREVNADPFEVASIRRKCLAQIIRASAAICDSETTCELFKWKVKEYSDIVDDKTGVNNYAEAVESLISCSQIDCKQWKSSLGNINGSEPASKPSDNVQCKNHEVSLQHIEFLLSNRGEEDDSEEEQSGKIDKNVSLGSSAQAIEHAGTWNSNFANRTNGDAHITARETKFSWQNKSFFTDYQKLQNAGINTKNSPRSASPYIPKLPPGLPSASAQFNNVPQQNTSRYCQTSQVNGLRSIQNVQQASFSSSTSAAVSLQSSSSHSFSTARDELVIQNQKKFGSRNSNTGCEYGAQKKSLGNTRRGVMNKFVPPVKNLSDEGGCGMMNRPDNSRDWNEDGVEDERLRNIDPKMIELIRSEIMDSGAPVHWEDIAGLQFAKATIQEIVVWPMLRPEIFTGLRRPPKGILLFGPPGTGKTLIGKCIASQSRSTFFSISASSLTSKWIGDGEKMVRALFAVARCHQPAVVFIDEIDSLLSQRSDTEHESSRRIKTEFLVQLDGATTGEEDRILIVGATNRPQELDEAARRRLVKRLYIPLPDLEARCQIVDHLMMKERNILTQEQINEIGKLTDGYSGADMKNLCQEASLGPIRCINFMDIQNISPEQVRPIAFEDFQSALRRVRASVSTSDLDTYVKWDKLYGSG